MSETGQDDKDRRHARIDALTDTQRRALLDYLCGYAPKRVDAELDRLESGGEEATHVEVIYRESWRAENWDEEIPSREGWQVRCAEHGLLGSPPGWAYESSGRANMVATRHRRWVHAGI